MCDFFNRINLLYGVVTEFCTDESCPTMTGGPKYEYLWCKMTLSVIISTKTSKIGKSGEFRRNPGEDFGPETR
jgi:hypothetical protein